MAEREPNQLVKYQHGQFYQHAKHRTQNVVGISCPRGCWPPTENIRLSAAPKGTDQLTAYQAVQASFLSSERPCQEMETIYVDQGVINANVQKGG